MTRDINLHEFTPPRAPIDTEEREALAEYDACEKNYPNKIEDIWCPVRKLPAETATGTGYLCMRRRGHNGDHIACSLDKNKNPGISARWPSASEQLSRHRYEGGPLDRLGEAPSVRPDDWVPGYVPRGSRYEID